MITSQTLGTTLEPRHAGGQRTRTASALVHSAAVRHKDGPDEELLRQHLPDEDCDALLDYLGADTAGH